MQTANGSIEEEDEDDSSDGSDTDSGDDASESASTSSEVPIRGKAKWFMQGYFVFALISQYFHMVLIFF